MLKINLITKHEQSQLDKLREAHRFYLENIKPVFTANGVAIYQHEIDHICMIATDIKYAERHLKNFIKQIQFQK